MTWPTRSSDLSPLDFLWGYLKSMVYETLVREEELVTRIITAAGEFTGDPSMFARDHRSLARRYRLYKNHTE